MLLFLFNKINCACRDLEVKLIFQTFNWSYILNFFFSLDNLLQAGCLTADSIVVVGQRCATQFYDEEHMADASTIVGVQTIYRYVIHYDWYDD
jgi:hypothetical protein